ncbi:MAG: 16S rRNA (adenine(1518)-N(6)/adenine(1519)-N(6))-dimethyltransferase RsmA, partial [Mycobacterium sp.]
TAPWPADEGFRERVFNLIDIAFAQRRKTSRNAFAEWAGSGNESASRLLAASIDPSRRGETLSVADFVRLLERSEEGQEPESGEPKPVVHHRQRREASLPSVR